MTSNDPTGISINGSASRSSIDSTNSPRCLLSAGGSSKVTVKTLLDTGSKLVGEARNGQL